MRLFTCFIIIISLFLTVCVQPEPSIATDETGSAPAEWRWYGADGYSSKHAAFDQINAANVKDLEIIWQWDAPPEKDPDSGKTIWTMPYEPTPVFAHGVLYTSTSLGQAVAIDAKSGTTLWQYDPKSYQEVSPFNFGFVHRGVAYWESGSDRRVLYGTLDGYLTALDAATGKLISTFGENGRIDLTKGLRREVDRNRYNVTSPPIICKGVVIVGASISDNKVAPNMPPGDIRGFDVVSGKLLWTFNSIPQEDEYGVETWEEESWKTTGNTNVWTMMSFDEELGYIYLPFSTPTNDFYGGHRKGDNLFSESLVCLDARTGKRVWHYQMVRHGLWDYDLPCAPNLLDITVDGKRIKAVAQVSKQAFCYVFNRVTGEPIWPIEDRTVSASTVPGERAAETQPFPTKPAPFDHQGLTDDDLIDFTPELRAKAKEIVSQWDYGPLFTPPTLKGTLSFPGALGGASWAGAALHPDSGMLYVPSQTMPMVFVVFDDGDASVYDYQGGVIVHPEGPESLPFTKPPYGRVTAIDLNTGEHKWMTAIGEGPTDHPALEGLGLSNIGWPRRSFVMTTKGLLFVAQMGKAKIVGLSDDQNRVRMDSKTDDAYLRAYHLETGVLIAEKELPANATGSPMSYVINNKQYIAVPVGGAGLPPQLVVLGL